MSKQITFFAILFLLLPLSPVCQGATTAQQQETFLDQPVKLMFNDPADGSSGKIEQSCIHLLEQLEKDYASTFQGSRINELNQFAGKKPVQVNDETIDLLTWSHQLSERSKGKYDATTAVYLWAYGFGQGDYRVPAFYQIDQLKSLVNYRLIMIDKEDNAVLFKRDGVQIQVDPLLTGWAFIKLNDFLKRKGIKNAYCQIGQNVMAFGKSKDGKKRMFKVKPTWKPAKVIPAISFDQGQFLVYERFSQSFTDKGHHYHRVVDPETGDPVNESNMIIVFTPDMETKPVPPVVLMSMKPENAVMLIENEKKQACMIIDEKNRQYYSKNWQKLLK